MGTEWWVTSQSSAVKTRSSAWRTLPPRPGDATLSSDYLGKSETFDRAIGKFALAYGDQTERDHRALRIAVKPGRLKAVIDEDE